MPRPKSGGKAGRPKAQKIKLDIKHEDNYCRRCQTVKNRNLFYDAMDYSLDKNGSLSICKQCCLSLFNELMEKHKDMDKAIYLTCQKLNIRYSFMAMDQTKSHIETMVEAGRKADSVFGIYKSKLSSLVGKINEKNQYLTFEHSDAFGENKDVKVRSDNEDCGINLEYLRSKWGSELPDGDLFWLEQKFDEWYDNYDIQGKAMQLLVEQLCFEELIVYKDRQIGRDVSKRLKSIQEMLKSSKLSPRQETASDMAEFQTISEFIKKVEQSKPFVKIDTEHKDVDKMEQQWRSIAGAIARTMGKPDDNTKVFDEFFKDDTMDLSSLNKGGA